MEQDYKEAERYYQAQKKVKEIRKFYEHLTIYILVNLIVMVVNFTTSPGHLWFLYCLFGWGIAVVWDGLETFGYTPFFNKGWEERKIKEILEEENKKANWK